LQQRVVTSSGSCHNVEIWLRINQGFDAVAQYAIVFYEENLDPFQAIGLSLVCSWGPNPGVNGREQYRESDQFRQDVMIGNDQMPESGKYAYWPD